MSVLERAMNSRARRAADFYITIQLLNTPPLFTAITPEVLILTLGAEHFGESGVMRALTLIENEKGFHIGEARID